MKENTIELRDKTMTTDNPSEREIEIDCFIVKGKEICADKGIAEYIKEINELGIPTVASCSGMEKDGHITKNGRRVSGTYISIEVPTEAEERYHIFRFPYDITGKENNYCQCIEEAFERAGLETERTKFMMFLPTIRGGFSCHVPTTDEPAGSPDFMKSYEEREERLKLDPCSSRVLSDEEIEKRLGKFVENLKDLNCIKRFQEIENVQEKCKYCTK